MIPDKESLKRVSPTAVMESNLARLVGAELDQVRVRLQQTIQTPYPLLDDYLTAHLHTHYPRAILVLLTSRLGRSEAGARVALAGAIEMLYLAANVHNDIPRGDVDTSGVARLMLGSAILFGDYCFSQASVLAAQTRNPAVVACFANALATLSERRVVTLIEQPQQPHVDDAILFAAAAESGALLAGLPHPFRYAVREAAAAFGEVLTDSETALPEAIAMLDALVQDSQVTRPMVRWLRSRRAV